TVYATFFYIDFDNLISRLGTNTDDAYSRGIEAGFQWNILNQLLSLSAHYTWVDTEDESAGLGQRLPNYPTHSLSANLRASPWRSLKLDTSILWVGNQLESFPLINSEGVFIDGSPSAALDGGTNPGYFIWNLAASYTFDLVEGSQSHPQEIKVYGKINNLLNNRYEASFGFPSPGINFLAGMDLLF
ncbi:MAG: TonB-dependent receptor, partial [Deltaproteobacteria bacterium]|nr:TonB-dependent receptor [Deltaproteobacteria bacterium]